MAQMVKCKSCKKEVAQNAKVCPHCGQKDPGVNYLVGCLGLIIIVAVIAYFMVDFGDEETQEALEAQEVTSQEGQSQKQISQNADTAIINSNDVASLGISISKREYADDPAQIFLKRDSENLYVIEIDKSKLKTGYSWTNENDKWSTYENWPVRIWGYFSSNTFSLQPVPECKGKCYVRVTINEYDKVNKKATFTISAKLLNKTKYIETKNENQKHIEIIGFDNLELEITNTNKKTYFDNLTLLDKLNLQDTKKYNVKNAAENTLKTLPSYTIEKSECMKPYKCSYDIRLLKRITEEEISLIANKLKASTDKVDRIFITYYLPCMKIDNGAWAASNFNPELKINIMEFMLSANPTCDANDKTKGNAVKQPVSTKNEVKHVTETQIDKWWVGGTLHKATVREWKKSTYKNKLATAGDLLAVTSWKGKLKNSSDFERLKEKAALLVHGVNIATESDVADNLQITEVVAALMVSTNELDP